MEKRKKEDERRQTGGTELRVSPKAILKRSEAREKRKLTPYVRRTYGVVEKVDEKRNSITVLIDKRTKADEFRVEETSKIIWNKEEIPFSELKVGMRISFVDKIDLKKGRIATAINVISAKEDRKLVISTIRNSQ